MRLLVVDHNAVDPTQRVVYDRLAETGEFELRIVVPRSWFDGFGGRKGQRESVDAKPGRKVEIIPEHAWLHSRTHRMIYPSLARHLRDFDPEVVLINAEPENYQTGHAAFLLRQRPCRLVFTTWRNIDHRTVGYPYRFESSHRRMEEYVLARADHGVAFLEEAKSIFSRHGYEHISVIPPAIDTGTFQPDGENLREQLGLTRFTIGYLGRFVYEKGIHHLLRAAKNLDVQFLMVGDGPWREEIRRLSSKLGMRERTVWVGPVERTRIPPYLRSMDVLVLPSCTCRYWKEQFGRALAEAMACRVAVIGSSSGEIPSTIGDGGLVFPEGDQAALSAALANMAANPAARKRLAEKGERRVREHFSPDVVAAGYKCMLHSLIK